MDKATKEKLEKERKEKIAGITDIFKKAVSEAYPGFKLDALYWSALLTEDAEKPTQAFIAGNVVKTERAPKEALMRFAEHIITEGEEMLVPVATTLVDLITEAFKNAEKDSEV